MIGAIGATDKLTKSHKIWLEKMGTEQFPLTPNSNVYKPRGKKIFVERKRNDLSAYRIIKNLNFVDSVQEAGVTAMIVALK